MEILKSEFHISPKEAMFSYTVSQLNGFVDARVERNERSEKEVKKEQDRGASEKPKGTVRDLKLMFGKVREPGGVETG